MKLTKKEKTILTLLYETPKKGFIRFAWKYCNYPEKDIKRIVDKLLKAKLVEIIKINGKEWYCHTSKFPDEMLDYELSCRLGYNYEKPVISASKKLEEKIR